MADVVVSTDNGVVVRRDARRYETFSVSLFPQEVEVLDRIGAIYGMGRSQTVRYIVNDWERMKKEQEQS